jgi:hypothetical protein
VRFGHQSLCKTREQQPHNKDVKTFANIKILRFFWYAWKAVFTKQRRKDDRVFIAVIVSKLAIFIQTRIIAVYVFAFGFSDSAPAKTSASFALFSNIEVDGE